MYSVNLDGIVSSGLAAGSDYEPQPTQPASAGDVNRFAQVMNQNSPNVQNAQSSLSTLPPQSTGDANELSGLDSPEDLASTISQLMFALQPIDISSFYGIDSDNNPFDFDSNDNPFIGSFGDSSDEFFDESSRNGSFG